jgi:Tol biopolymer transport system component
MKGSLRLRADPARLGIVGAIAGFILALAFPHPASAAFPGRAGKIAFESRYLGGRLYTVRPNGERQQQIARRESSNPAFSADGRRIVFARYRHGNYDLYRMRADGSHKIRLTNTDADEGGASFSPSGQTIVFARDHDRGNSNLWKMRAGGGHQRRLTHTPGASEGGPKYSPNGRRIVFVKDFDLAIMRSDGSHAHRIFTTRNVYEAHPDFSPDGSPIVFSRSSVRRIHDEIFSVRADGSRLRRLTRSEANDSFPVFSPTGGRIAFSSDRHRAPGSFRIYKMRADGTHVRRITGGHRGADQSPSWGVAP